MKMSQMFPSNYLGQDDVPSPFVTTIIKVTRDELKNDNGNEIKTVLHFAGVEKAFICNKTNAFTLCDAYGDDSDFWIGKTVEVFVDANVTYGGKRVGGVRLRIPKAGAASRGAPTARNGQSWDFTQAVSLCAQAGISKDELIAHLKSKGLAGFQGPRDTPTVQALIAAKEHAPEQSFDEPAPTVSNEEIPF